MKRLLMNKFVIGLLCTLFALPVMAQEDELKDLAGYVDFGDLSATYGEPKITINLGGTMLNFVSMMSSVREPGNIGTHFQAQGHPGADLFNG